MGPDELHPKLLKQCAVQIRKPLLILFKKTLEVRCAPKDWKLANVVALYKKGSRSKADNYQPVSLTSQICKIMESLVCDSILEHVDRKGLFSIDQHGFTGWRSCLLNLLETPEIWTSAMEEGYDVDVIYLDYQKAFDTAPIKTHGET